MKPAQPVLVLDLFPETLDSLLSLLRSLTPVQWQAPTTCDGWNVHDVALHLWGGDIGVLSRRRDAYQPGSANIQSWEDLVQLIDCLNADWLTATRRISPRLLTDLMTLTGHQINEYFASLNPYTLGEAVNWAGPEPAPVWLDLAREYTERWHHQQHIRDALNLPDLKSARFLHPVIDTFLRALPHTLRDVHAPPGTTIHIQVTGDGGGDWYAIRQIDAWKLFVSTETPPTAHIQLSAESAWRLFTKGIDAAYSGAVITGERDLAATALQAVAIIG